MTVPDPATPEYIIDAVEHVIDSRLGWDHRAYVFAQLTNGKWAPSGDLLRSAYQRAKAGEWIS